MANHKSALKRIKQAAKRRLANRYQYKTTRTLIKKIRTTSDKAVAAEMLPLVVSSIDKCAKKNIIHKNKASNLKSKLTVLVSKL